jgi:hypothetical protein
MRQRSGGSWFEASPDKEFTRPYLEKTHHKKALVEWLKVKALRLWLQVQMSENVSLLDCCLYLPITYDMQLRKIAKS